MVKFHSPTPILRMFDEDKAREFYLGFLDFAVNWEHRFEDNLPLYMGITRGECALHLSEHHGDSTPGGAVRIELDDIEAFHAGLSAKDYHYARPGIDETPYGTREVRVIDPFGNKLIFFEPVTS
jgi:uncharacterized glyoxalase superfamily protein PhnB